MVPFATMPLLIKALGLEEFGRIGFSSAVIAYFIVLVEWGYSLGSTRDISLVRDNKNKRSEIFWSVVLGRAFLSLLGGLFLYVMVCFSPRLESNSPILLISWLAVLASVISPNFYFQGVEKMATMAVVNLSVRVISVPVVYYFIRSADDVLLAVLIQSGCIFLASFANFVAVIRKTEVYFVPPSITRTLCEFKKNKSLFISNAAISLYTNSSAVILGFVATDAAVGVFTAAYTIVKAGLALLGPLSQAVFPRISYMLKNDRVNGEKALRVIFLLQGAIGMFIMLGIAILSPVVVPLVFGGGFNSVVWVLWVFAPLIFCVALSNVLGMQIMIPLGYDKPFSITLIAAGLFNIILAIPLGMVWDAGGVAFSMVAAEVLVTVGMLIFVRKHEPKVWLSLFNRKKSYA